MRKPHPHQLFCSPISQRIHPPRLAAPPSKTFFSAPARQNCTLFWQSQWPASNKQWNFSSKAPSPASRLLQFCRLFPCVLPNSEFSQKHSPTVPQKLSFLTTAKARFRTFLAKSATCGQGFEASGFANGQGGISPARMGPDRSLLRSFCWFLSVSTPFSSLFSLF